MKLEFEVTAFRNRRKLPTIRGTCLKVIPGYHESLHNNEIKEEYFYDDNGNIQLNGSSYDTPDVSSNKNIVLNISVPRSLKTKKNTIIKFEDDDEDEDEEPVPSPIPVPVTPVETKIRKKKKSIVPEPEPSPVKEKRKKRKRHEESELESELDPLEIPKTKKIKKEVNIW